MMNDSLFMADTLTFACCMSIGLLLVLGADARAGTPEIVSVTQIWDQGRYQSFTDLTRFQGRWYCTFRDSDSHIWGEDGKIRVIMSRDAHHWDSVAYFAEEGRDLRDPKICVTADGRLMVTTGACVYRNEVEFARDTRVTFSPDGSHWDALQVMTFNAPGEHATEGHWFWRTTWHEKTAYGVSKLGGPHRALLFSSADGIHHQLVTPLDLPDETDGTPTKPTEATVRMLRDGSMMILFRQAWIGLSPPPFTHWTWHDVGTPATAHATRWAPRNPTIGGPNFIQLPDGSLWGTGRQYHLPIPPTNWEKRTVLARMDRTSYTPVLILPSGGDSSYAGMVWYEGELWISYYSCVPGLSAFHGRQHHTNSGKMVTAPEQDFWSTEVPEGPPWPRIYLARVRFR